MSQHSGDGTLSSSDGQRFPLRGKSLTGRHLSRYFGRGQGFTTYTHVSDQHSTYAAKVIMAYAPEAHFTLDGIFGNITDLPIVEHSTDTAGATLANFALFDLTELTLSARIRDMGKLTLCRTGAKADFTDRYPHAGRLLTRRCNTELVRAHWDDLLRVAASVKHGHCTAAMVVGKLCSSKRQQNALAAAIKEWGLLRRTLSLPGSWRTRRCGGVSPASSTRARTSTPCAGTSSTPTRARYAGVTTSSRPSRPGA
jgi:TnpA family transposase